MNQWPSCIYSRADVIDAFQVFSQRKSFVVMAATPEEKAQWIENLTFYANQALADADTKRTGYRVTRLMKACAP